MTLDATIEALLFAAAKPCAVKRLAELTGKDADDVKKALATLEERLEEADSGLMLIRHGHEAELVTRPEASAIVSLLLKAEAYGELTRPSLEALTILAYRGPLTRPELEQIRGVQSSLILRNLMMRGLVEEREEMRLGQPKYAVTVDFLRALGLSSVEELADYEELRGHATVVDVLSQLETVETHD
ncbi:SMC-Scp complex subunit ScpB [Candidatus Uhrbacteria bacterium]|nr:SMC-Scp complex subunit ScpB [Candidatus Uhrbacteria bacterium]